jgi:hypothetical protein
MMKSNHFYWHKGRLQDAYLALKEICEQELNLNFHLEYSESDLISAHLDTNHRLEINQHGHLNLFSFHPPLVSQHKISMPCISSLTAHRCLELLATWLNFHLNPHDDIIEPWSIFALGSLLEWSGSLASENVWQFADQSTLHREGPEIHLHLKKPSIYFARTHLKMGLRLSHPLHNRDSRNLLDNFLWLALGDKAWEDPLE